MFQRFFTNTIVSGFIKALLQSTPLPKYKTVKAGDVIYAGLVYTYGIHLIKCTLGGTLDKKVPPYANVAQYTIISNAFDDPTDHSGTFFLGKQYANRTDRIRSLNYYYDEDTHEALGDYLRCYRDLKGIDLMPFYNCFSYRMATDFYIEHKDKVYNVVESYSDKYKVMLVPIQIGMSYTIYLDSQSSVIIKPIFYNRGIIKDYKSGDILSDRIGLVLPASGTTSIDAVELPQTSFSSPVVVQAGNPSSGKRLDILRRNGMNRYAYLAIQTSKDNQSSIVVIEGKYGNEATLRWAKSRPLQTGFSIKKQDETDENVMIEPVNHVSTMSLTRINDGNIYAFSDRLIEYLLKNVIDSDDTIDENTVRVQERARELFGYDENPNGVYDNKLKTLLYTKYIREVNPLALDITGYTDKDIEGWLQI